MAFTKVAPAGIGSTPGDGYRIGDSFLHSTGVEITNINATGILTAASLDISGAIDFDGQTNLDHVGIAGITTTTDDIIIGADNKKLKLGAGEELQLYQAGNHSIIQHNGGHYLLLRSNAFAASSADGTKNMFAGFPDTHSSMYYNGSYKIRTQNTGAEIVGTIVATGADINGDIDVDGHTNLDNVSVAGITTISSSGDALTIGAATNASRNLIFSADRGADAEFGSIIAKNTGGNIAAISFYAGDDGTNKDNGQIVFRTSPHSGQPLFERMRLTEGGTLLFGITEAHTTVLGSRAPRIQLESTTVDASSIFLNRDGNDGGGPYLFLGHGRGGTGLIQDGDNLGNLMFVGGTGSNFKGAANISCLVDIPSGGAASNTSMPGALVLSTSNHNQTSPVEAMRIRPDGRIVIGGSTAVSFTPHGNADDLVVGATSAANRGITILGGNNNRASIYFGDTDDNDVGQIDYNHNNNAMAFHTNAGERLRITSSGGLESYSTSDANPNFKFRSDDTNWHGYLNQTVHGATISTILSCGGTWTVDGTTYAATKDYNGSFGTAALIIHNQYNSTATGGELVFVTKANGSSTTDGAVTEKFRIDSSGKISTPLGTTTRIGVADRTSGTGAGGSLCVTAGAARGSGQNSGDLILASGRGNNSANAGNITFGYNNGADGTSLDHEWLRIGSNGSMYLGYNSSDGLPVQDGSIPGNLRLFSIHGTGTSLGIKLTNSTTGTTTGDGVDIRLHGQTAMINQNEAYDLQLQSKGELAFRTGSTPAERLRITSDGTVNCLGTTALKVPTGTTAQRPTGTTGMLRYNTTTEELEAYGSNNYWFNVKDGKFQGEGDIGTASNPAYSGKQLKDLGKSSGNYYIKPQGYSGSAILAYVDMTTNGGGWVLVAAFPLVHSNLEMSSNTSGLNESSVKNYATTVPSNNSAAFYNKNFINYLFHQNATSDPYSTYSIAGVHGRAGNGYILWEVRANSSNRNSTIDAFKSIYKTNEVNNKFDVRYYENTSNNTLNHYVGTNGPSFNSYANFTNGRAGTQDGNGSYHYLIDDISGGYQWAFRENIDDNPGNYQGYDLSNIFIR